MCIPPTALSYPLAMGWTREEYKKIGAKYGFLRSCRENNWYRLRRFFPPIHVHADIHNTRLLRRNKAGPSGMSNYDH